MKTFEHVAAQGEITIFRIRGGLGRWPSSYKPLAPDEKGQYVIGHSETGHHHVLSETEGVQLAVLDRSAEGMRILRAILKNPVSLEHCREFDQHESIMLEPGEYEFRIAREFDPYAELVRLSAD